MSTQAAELCLLECAIDECDSAAKVRGLCGRHYQRARAAGNLPPRVKPLAEKIVKTCPCGKVFTTTQNRIDAGRGMRCSKQCHYLYRAPRPSGLKYEIRAENRAWWKPGHDVPSGEANPAWRGEEIGYRRLHGWIRQEKQKPDACEHCGGADRPLQWANKSHEYHRDLEDWLALCAKCHGRYDSGQARGAATRKYGARAVQEGL